MKVHEVIDRIIDSCYEGERLIKTCDILVSGHPQMEVTGVVTTFMATVDVLKAAVQAGANMIITHEPTYFNGLDDVAWLENDPVYLAKKQLIDQHNIAIWRFHDYMHMAKTDKIYDGLKKQLDWTDMQLDPQSPWVYVVEPTKVSELAEYLKVRLELSHIRIVGDLNAACSRVGILVGGGSLGLGRETMPIELMYEKDLDVMICGEIVEWTLSAYINDASMIGMNKAMIVVGHERTEEWGMKDMAEWAQSLIAPIPVSFVDAKEPFKYL